jgi:hypothetical protein
VQDGVLHDPLEAEGGGRLHRLLAGQDFDLLFQEAFEVGSQPGGLAPAGGNRFPRDRVLQQSEQQVSRR